MLLEEATKYPANTKSGNNNAWCQDNAVSWFDWSLTTRTTPTSSALSRARLIALRRRHPPDLAAAGNLFHQARATLRGTAPSRASRISPREAASWQCRSTVRRAGHNRPPTPPVAAVLDEPHVWREGLPFVVPTAPNGMPWRRSIDTALASPLDIVGLDRAPVVEAKHSLSRVTLLDPGADLGSRGIGHGRGRPGRVRRTAHAVRTEFERNFRERGELGVLPFS